MDACAMNALRAVPVLLLSLWLVTDGAVALAGFSDGLVGKGKAPAAPPAGQREFNKPPMEKGQTPVGPPSQLTAPGVQTKSVVQGSFDIVALRIGMTQEEAVAIVQGRKGSMSGKPISFEIMKESKHQGLDQGAVPRTRFLLLSDAKSVLKAFDLPEEPSKNQINAQDSRLQQFAVTGQIEAFGLQFPNVPNEARVSGITRVQRLASPVHPDTIRAALIQKYGPPAIDDQMGLVWFSGIAGQGVSAQDLVRCRGIVLPPGAPLDEFDYSLSAVKGCGEQLTVQLKGTSEAVVMLQTTLYHHQRLIDEREATQKATLSRLGLTPEQTKQAPAPQF